MKEINKSRISLRNDAWAKLDSVATTIQGAIPSIVEEMQKVMEQEVIVSLCKYIGIYSAGFLFWDVQKGVVFFEHNDKKKKENTSYTYMTRYLWDDAQLHKEWSSCLHRIFLATREKQSSLQSSLKTWAADYFLNLPLNSKNQRALEIEKDLREKFNVHYCSVGEMLYTTAVWRILSIARDLGWSDRNLSEINIPLNQETDSKSQCHWYGKELEFGSDEKAKDIFTKLWGNLIGPQKTWHDEWPALLLSCKDLSKPATHREAVIQFIKKSGIFNFDSHKDFSNDDVFNLSIQRSIPAYLKWLYRGKSFRTIEESICIIEQYARFPILPFYFWNALNQQPVCYSVIPIWTSQNHMIVLPNGKCPYLGLALTGLQPVKEWDWTLNNIDEQKMSNAEPLVLINLLRLMARPLVEGNLYYGLYEDVSKLQTFADNSVRECHQGEIT